MFVIKVSEEIVKHCEVQVATYNFGKRSFANGNKEQQLTGVIGQSIIMNLFGLGYVQGKEGFDDGVDLVFNNKKIDVKTMGRTTNVRSDYTNNFLKAQDYFNTEIYIFCSFNKVEKEITVCGWIDKDNFTNKRNFFPKGTVRNRSNGTSFTTFADLYEIDMNHLNKVESIEQLKQQLNQI